MECHCSYIMRLGFFNGQGDGCVQATVLGCRVDDFKIFLVYGNYCS